MKTISSIQYSTPIAITVGLSDSAIELLSVFMTAFQERCVSKRRRLFLGLCEEVLFALYEKLHLS